MTKMERQGSSPDTRMARLFSENGALRHEATAFARGYGTSAKDTKGSARDKQQTCGRDSQSDASLSERFARFEHKLNRAEEEDDGQSGDGDGKSDEAAMLVLFETGNARNFEASAVQPSKSTFPQGALRAEEIFMQVSRRLDAEMRPGPAVSSGPVQIVIPLQTGGSGVTRIEVTLSEGGVAVKLCVPVAQAGASQELLAAASQLGQLLQAHLPGRRVKIVQSSAESDDKDKDSSKETHTTAAGTKEPPPAQSYFDGVWRS
jgi:hypothetical protein